MLELHEIDCAITVKPRFHLTKSFGWHLVRREPLTLISPHEYGCEKLGDYFSSKPLIRMDRNSATGAIVTDFLNHAGISPTELFEMDAQETIVLLVSQGLGISLLPDYGFQTSEHRPIRKIVVSRTHFLRDIGVLYRRGAKNALVDALSRSMSNAMVGA